MSELIYDKIRGELIGELLGDGVNLSPYLQTVIDNYIADLRIKTGGTFKLDENIIREELLQQEGWFNIMIKAFKSKPIQDKLYTKSYERLKEAAKNAETWGDLFSEIYLEDSELSEIFVRLIEEEENVAITSAKQLQEITGIDEIYGYWDEEKGETVPYGDKMPTKKEAQEIAYKQVEECFISAMSHRYSKALEDILQAGGRYEDLLKVKPAYFNLPEKWKGGVTSDMETSIFWAIDEVFRIAEPNTAARPDLKAIAQEIEAPYSVLLDVHKICNGWKLR